MTDDRFLSADFIGRRNWSTLSFVWRPLYPCCPSSIASLVLLLYQCTVCWLTECVCCKHALWRLLYETFCAGQEHCPTLWVGTNAGTVYIHQLTIPSTDKRSTDEVQCVLCKFTFFFRHRYCVSATVSRYQMRCVSVSSVRVHPFLVIFPWYM